MRSVARGSDPVADAALAAQRSEHGLFAVIQDDSEEEEYTLGVTCFTPGARVPQRIGTLWATHTPRDVDDRARSYAARFNQARVQDPEFRWRDLCRGKEESDAPRYPDDPQRLGRVAQHVTGPARDLWEAARRGSAADVRRYLRTTTIDALDPMQMTALAWAVARDNRPAVEVLLARGADPWMSDTLLYPAVSGGEAAILFGRRDLFLRMLPRRRTTDNPWSAWQLRYAMLGGSLPILRAMLRQPHDERGVFLGKLPTRAMAAAMLDLHPALAGDLLDAATPSYSKGRPDLASLAEERLAKAARHQTAD